MEQSQHTHTWRSRLREQLRVLRRGASSQASTGSCCSLRRDLLTHHLSFITHCSSLRRDLLSPLTLQCFRASAWGFPD